MPDGRMVSRSISDNLELSHCSLEADFLFQRCIPHLDREGRMVGSPDLIRSRVAPLRKEITDEVVERCIHELAFAVGPNKKSLVVWYEVRGRKFLWFPAFASHQTGARFQREAASRHESPLDPDAIIISGASPELVRSQSGVGPDLVRVSEVKLSEVEVEGKVEVEVKGLAAESVGSVDVPKKNFTPEQRLILALNSAQLEHPGLDYNLFEPVSPTHAKSVAAAREILQVVPFDFAETVVRDAIRGRTPDHRGDAVRSLDYLRERVLEKWKSHQIRESSRGAVPSAEEKVDAMLVAMKRGVA